MMPENEYLFECLLESCPEIRNLVAPSGTSCPQLYALLERQQEVLESLAVCLEQSDEFGLLRRVHRFPKLHTLAVEGDVHHEDIYYIDAVLKMAPLLTQLSFGGPKAHIYSNVQFLASCYFNVKHLRVQGVMYSSTIYALADVVNNTPSLQTVDLTFHNLCQDLLHEELTLLQGPDYVRSTCKFRWAFHESE
jgi:hypothetical protein